MKLSTTISVFLLALALALTVNSIPASAETNLNFVLGGKFLDSDDWPSGDPQGSLAFLSTFGPDSWPVQVAIDVLGSATSEDSFNISGPGFEVKGEELVQSTFEFDVGVRKIWRSGRARPFVGGGLAFIWGQQERARFVRPPFEIPPRPGIPVPPVPPVIVSDSDSAPGAWIDGGIFWRLGQRFNLGLEGRFSVAELKLGGRDVQAGGVNIGLILGWGWGGGARIVK